MTTPLRHPLAWFGVLLVLLSGSACSWLDDAPTTKAGPPIAIVVGNHALAQPYAATDPILTGIADDAVSRRATVRVIPVDGAPQAGKALPLADRSTNDLQREMQDRNYRAALLRAIVTARPALPEADYLTAIAVGCRSVRGAPGGQLVVLGSGLSTATLRLQDGLLANESVDDVVEQLAAADAIPDLSSCPPIRWAGLGQIAAPQRALTLAARAELQELYQAIVRRGGGSVVFVEAPVAAGTPQPDLPSVTAVPIDTVPTIGVLPAAQVGFEPGEAVLRDPAAADVALRRLAGRITARQPADVWVIGTTSSENDSVPLSTARAEEIAALLEDRFGVTAHLHPVGLGAHFRGFVPDRNPDGSLNERKARLNRMVLVTTDPAAAQPAH